MFPVQFRRGINSILQEVQQQGKTQFNLKTVMEVSIERFEQQWTCSEVQNNAQAALKCRRHANGMDHTLSGTATVYMEDTICFYMPHPFKSSLLHAQLICFNCPQGHASTIAFPGSCTELTVYSCFKLLQRKAGFNSDVEEMYNVIL